MEAEEIGGCQLAGRRGEKSVDEACRGYIVLEEISRSQENVIPKNVDADYIPTASPVRDGNRSCWEGQEARRRKPNIKRGIKDSLSSPEIQSSLAGIGTIESVMEIWKCCSSAHSFDMKQRNAADLSVVPIRRA
ncbi:hypothetical protein HPP92_016930 [Vanilla planifolia]|uniref:Uncharacterized protein n=1 Tax=Vanilla planifolia TaxID=51239 RepID=A0A835QH17_VANPL|nr:hypothetical protein HPP92_016930 [Vanilla planifolia]